MSTMALNFKSKNGSRGLGRIMKRAREVMPQLMGFAYFVHYVL